MRSWAWLVAAALTEVGWVGGLKAADGALDWLATAACVLASFALALGAARRLPATTVYVVFVGLGAAGTAMLDAAVFGQALGPAALACLTLLIGGVIGLKLTSTGNQR
ncbi:multidrug resistance protein SMR [Salinisphaera orenii MK-B5]|uniref:Guanidinium exporter n=1 Tax=Salinisphaera orenii MK-B5 TaxID=856730 RepID=A0A423PFR4_9GAMM|nr:SMR family transporter [Salinisphaera orenii]ROO24457.1 multidrug resistance protein SMR [Salinisphaera orenii MK-B5]